MTDLAPDPMCPDCDHAVLHHQIDLAYKRILNLQNEIRTLRVQLDEEHQAFLAEQRATWDALQELDECRASQS